MSGDGRVNVDELVRDGLVRILQKSGKTVPVLSDDVRLDELGVSSLDLTTLIVEITARLGIDDDGRAEAEVATVGDLRRVFLPDAGARAESVSDPLAATRRRAEARRAGGR
jgi:acyl carrier protein